MKLFARGLAAMLLLALAASTTAGCNTMRGVGKDVEATGQHIQKATE